MKKATQRRISLVLLLCITLISTVVFTRPGTESKAMADDSRITETDTDNIAASASEMTADAADKTTEEVITSEDSAAVSEEPEESISLKKYEANLYQNISFSDLSYYDSTGRKLSYSELLSGFTYTYNRECQTPDIQIHYDNSGNSTLLYPSYYSYIQTACEHLNATGTYEASSDQSCINAGSYHLVLTCTTPFSLRTYNSSTGQYDTTYYTLTDTLVIPFTILPKNLNDADITCSSISDLTYKGNPLYPNVTVKHKSSASFYGYTLIPNVSYDYNEVYNTNSGEYEKIYYPAYNSTYDYTLEYLNHTKAGQGIIRITGVGNYTGTRNITFNIFCHVSSLTYTGYKNTVYTGKAITFSGFAVSESGRRLTLNVDYTVTYLNNKQYGEATIRVTGKGYYTGTYNVYFGIIPKKVTGIAISSPKKLQAKITWKKCKGAQGFEIARYNTKKKKYEVIAIMLDGNWQVYQDASSSLKNNISYKYRIRPFVASKDGARKYYGAAATKSGKVTKAFKELNIPIYTGCTDVDYAAEVICRKVIKKGMSQQQKVKALYDWVVDNCTHNKDYEKHKTVYSYKKNAKKAKTYSTKIWKSIYTGKADCNFDGYGYNSSSNSLDYYSSDDYKVVFPQTIGAVNGKGQFNKTYAAFQTHKGGCSYITRLFKALVNHAGLECTLVDGSFKNKDGSKMYHYWCYIRVNKKCAWYDVDIATSNKKARYIWYKKGAKFWHTCHIWNTKENENIPSYLN